VWMRRFSGGVSVVNATRSPVTVPLGALYRRLRGTQAPAVNNGRLARSVTIPSQDGIVLAKPGSVGADPGTRPADSPAAR
jgi:hypothetical protein